MAVTWDSTFPSDVDQEDVVSLEYQRVLLSRRAALAAVARPHYGSVLFKSAPQGVQHTTARMAFRVFSSALMDFAPVGAAVSAAGDVLRFDAMHGQELCDKLLSSWVRQVKEAEASSTRLAFMKILPHDPLAYAARPAAPVTSRLVLDLYSIMRMSDRALLEMPRHVLSFCHLSHPSLADLGRPSEHDGAAVLELTLGMFDPTSSGSLSSMRATLQAARMMENR